MNVLVVDDAKIIRGAFKRILEIRKVNHAIVKSGKEAIDKVKAESFDLIFLDIVLPDMDGVETLRAIKEISPDTPVVMITAHPVEVKIREALELGAVEYLFKPFNKEDISRLLAEASKKTGFKTYPRMTTGEIRRSRRYPFRKKAKTNILVVNNDQLTLKMFTRASALRRCEAIYVKDGFQAIEAAKKKSFDIIFIDMALPGKKSGVETFRAIHRISPNIPVIMMADSTETEKEELRQTLKDGAKEYLRKPFGDVKDICNIIEKYQ